MIIIIALLCLALCWALLKNATLSTWLDDAEVMLSEADLSVIDIRRELTKQRSIYLNLHRDHVVLNREYTKLQLVRDNLVADNDSLGYELMNARMHITALQTDRDDLTLELLGHN